MRKCPVCDYEIKGKGVTATINGKQQVFCCKECADKAKADAKATAKK